MKKMAEAGEAAGRTEALYAFWLSDLPKIGCKKIQHLLKRFSVPEAVFSASREALLETAGINKTDVEQIINSRDMDKIKYRYDAMCRKNILFTWSGQPEYPKKLQVIDDAPFSLFYRGSLPKEERPVVAVVGARTVSHAGSQLAQRMGRQLAENGICVVSGLARGVDIASQRGVLEVAGGSTYGVLGCGIDLCYPEENIESYMLIQEHGGVISEYAPGVLPLPYHFPLRNRIISGLSDAILVIEAGEHSGSLITARLGLDQGKDIFVVPGDIWNPSYAGSNQLIREGAALVTNTRDILDGLGIFLDEDVSERKKKCEVLLETTEKIVYSYLSLVPIHLSEIVEISGLSVQKTMELLLSLEMKGMVKDVGNHYFAVVFG